LSARVLQLRCLLREQPGQSARGYSENGFELPVGLVQLWSLLREEPLIARGSLIGSINHSSLSAPVAIGFAPHSLFLLEVFAGHSIPVPIEITMPLLQHHLGFGVGPDLATGVTLASWCVAGGTDQFRGHFICGVPDCSLHRSPAAQGRSCCATRHPGPTGRSGDALGGCPGSPPALNQARCRSLSRVSGLAAVFLMP